MKGYWNTGLSLVEVLGSGEKRLRDVVVGDMVLGYGKKYHKVRKIETIQHLYPLNQGYEFYNFYYSGIVEEKEVPVGIYHLDSNLTVFINPTTTRQIHQIVYKFGLGVLQDIMMKNGLKEIIHIEKVKSLSNTFIRLKTEDEGNCYIDDILIKTFQP